MFTDVTHREPVSRFATTTRRRVFMLLASIGFVLVSAGAIVSGMLMLVHNITEFTAWVVAVLVVYGGIMGLKFFGPVRSEERRVGKESRCGAETDPCDYSQRSTQ